jgi:hypothetical protein
MEILNNQLGYPCTDCILKEKTSRDEKGLALEIYDLCERCQIIVRKTAPKEELDKYPVKW